MQIAIISDTHLPRGRRALPARSAELIAGAELLLHAGDVTTLETVRSLEQIGPPLVGVHGNMDTGELRQAWPAERIVQVGEARIAMVHDPGPRSGRFGRLRARFGDRAQAVVFGHTHLPLHEARSGFQIFNPGSPTERRRAPRHAMGLAQVEGPSLRFELVDLG